MSTMTLPASQRVERGLRLSILFLIFCAAFLTRLFSVIRYESIIHEFDPWFNYRATLKLVNEGVYEFWNWFDDRSWYPLGRVVGGTVYPGLMLTAGFIHNLLHFFHFPVDIRNVCVFLAPAFSGLTAFAVYLLTKELHSTTAGLFAASFMAIVPGYISRSVAGSYDNEAIAIFLLMFCFYLWIKAVKNGSSLFATFTGLFYFYMVSAWGGYAFITNLIPLHVFTLLLMGRYSSNLYIAYCTWYAVGTMASFSIPFVNFNPIRSSDHMAALGVFGLLQIVSFAYFIKNIVSEGQFKYIFRSLFVFVLIVGIGAFSGLTYLGYISPWTGRFYSLWDSNYARVHMPIISSVSEHQPTAWSSLFFDLHHLLFLFPAGVAVCFRRLRNEHVFVIVYSVFASYFAGVMVRLILTLTPIVCTAAGIAIGEIISIYSLNNQEPPQVSETLPRSDSVAAIEQSNKTRKQHKKAIPSEDTNDFSKKTKKKQIPDLFIPTTSSRVTVFGMIFVFAIYFVKHCTWVTSVAYSSPSVVLSSSSPDGSRVIIDDFREAYYWLRKNTHVDATVMSWWDYGYQLAGFANRTTLVDNNTWNNTHIATVGLAMASTEENAYPILTKLDVDYILVIFGGLTGYSGDDINKFLWMVRIGEGVYPENVKEHKFFTSQGEYRVDDRATSTMRNSIMYKMCYYRYNDLFGRVGEDRARGSPISSAKIQFHTLEEAFTSERWIVRIYKVKKPDFLARSLRSVANFERKTLKELKDFAVTI